MLSKMLVVVLLTGMTAWGQEPSDTMSDAEKALRERVRQFYQLQVEKKFRQAEAYIAEDTKDLFYAGGKPDLAAFTITKVVMREGGTRADVTVRGRVSIFVMGRGMTPVELPTTGTWKIENGQWVWYVDPKAPIQTPFGDMKAGAATSGDPAVPNVAEKIKNFDVNAIRSQVTLDRQSVGLSATSPAQVVTITNGLSGPVDLTLMTKSIPGIGIDLDRKHLEAGEHAKLTFTRKSDIDSSGNVQIDVEPLGVTLDVKVATR